MTPSQEPETARRPRRVFWNFAMIVILKCLGPGMWCDEGACRGIYITMPVISSSSTSPFGTCETSSQLSVLGDLYWTSSPILRSGISKLAVTNCFPKVNSNLHVVTRRSRTENYFRNMTNDLRERVTKENYWLGNRTMLVFHLYAKWISLVHSYLLLLSGWSIGDCGRPSWNWRRLRCASCVCVVDVLTELIQRSGPVQQ